MELSFLNRRNIVTGQVAFTYLAYDRYKKSDQGFWATLELTGSLAAIWTPQFRTLKLAGVGSFGWGLLSNPYFMAAAVPVVTGGVISYAIDPEEGLDNYSGFITTGEMGNNPNYWDSDENDSGYFNVHQNFVNIISANRRAKSERVRKEAEAEYIQRYWERKAIAQQVAAEQNYGILLASYNALTDSQKRTYLAMYQDLLSPN
jgi:hypothetical protein